MKRDRSQLENILLACFEENEGSRSTQEDIKDYLFNHYQVNRGLTSSVLSQSRPIQSISDELLCVFAEAAYNVYGDDACNPEIFFTEAQIKVVQNTTFDIGSEIEGDIKFNNVLCVRPGQYMTVITSQRLSELLNSGRIVYRAETQRGTISKKVGDTIIKKMRINIKSASEIADEIINRRYEPTLLYVNALSDDEDACVYSGRNRTLTIRDGIEIDLTDGFHRTYGTIKALISNPTIDQPWMLCVTNWSIARTQSFIFQQDHKTPLSPEVRVSMDQNDLTTQIVTALNERMHNEMQGKIVTDYRSITEGIGHTLFSTMADGIEAGFKPQYQREIGSIVEFLINFYNELLPIIQQCESLTQSYLFYGYNLLAGHYYKNNIALDNLEHAVSLLSKDQSVDKKYYGQLTKRQRSKIEEWISHAIV